MDKKYIIKSIKKIKKEVNDMKGRMPDEEIKQSITLLYPEKPMETYPINDRFILPKYCTLFKEFNLGKCDIMGFYNYSNYVIQKGYMFKHLLDKKYPKLSQVKISRKDVAKYDDLKLNLIGKFVNRQQKKINRLKDNYPFEQQIKNNINILSILHANILNMIKQPVQKKSNYDVSNAYATYVAEDVVSGSATGTDTDIVVLMVVGLLNLVTSTMAYSNPKVEDKIANYFTYIIMFEIFYILTALLIQKLTLEEAFTENRGREQVLGSG